MQRIAPALLCALALALPAAARADAPETTIDYRAADPGAPVVTADNLLASERFWPYQTALTEAWTPPGAPRALGARVRGVVVRVEPRGLVRVDFGRDGVHTLPVANTDLIAEANRVREGQRTKVAPNYVLAVAPRLVDASGAAVDFDEAVAHAGFLALFADSSADGFDAMVKALAPLDGRAGAKGVIFPLNPQRALDLADRLVALGWPGYRMEDAYAASYTEAQLAGEPPAVLLVTPDGRLVFESAWGPGVVRELERALDTSFGAAARSAAR